MYTSERTVRARERLRNWVIHLSFAYPGYGVAFGGWWDGHQLKTWQSVRTGFFNGALPRLGVNSNMSFNAARQGVFDRHLISGMSNYSSV